MKRLLVAGAFALISNAALAQTAAPDNATLYIISPKDGQRISGPVTVQFGLRGMGVTRAGDTTGGVGHHHLLVDAEGELSASDPIPTDRRHLHFGGGQTETTLDLPPGKHTLQLALGDAEHRLFKPVVMSKKITISVVDPAQAATAAKTPTRKSVKKRRKVAQPRAARQ